jgi:16S rRNA processing protein RimM
MSSALPQDLVELGLIQDAQGLRGQIKVRPFSSDPVALLSTKSIWLSLLSPQLSRGARIQEAPRQYAVNGAKLHSGFVVMGLEGIVDRDQALAIKGARLLLSRAAFPQAESSSYYWVDLVGCQVIGNGQLPLGLVTEITENGAHAIMTVQGGDDRIHLIPFVPEIIQDVDLTQKQITVQWDAEW